MRDPGRGIGWGIDRTSVDGFSVTNRREVACAHLANVEAARILRQMCVIAQNIQAKRFRIITGAWVFLPDQHL